MNFVFLLGIFVAVVLAHLVFDYIKRSQAVERAKTDWMIGLPNVERFHTMEGMLEYCRQHLPNCYDILCYLTKDPVWQARLRNSDPLEISDNIDLYLYLEAIEFFATGKILQTQSFGSYRLIDSERRLRGHLFDHEDFVPDERYEEGIKEHFPLPPDFVHPDRPKDE